MTLKVTQFVISVSVQQTNRLPIPVSTIQFDRGAQISSHSPYIPRTGLDFLRGIPSLHIYQTFELNDSLSALSSETRFSVRAPFNEAVYVATESSKGSHRTYLGASRPFRLHLLDKTNQEALVLKRNMGIGLMCCTCVPQGVEVWLPPGDLVGVCIQSDLLILRSNIKVFSTCRSFKRVSPCPVWSCRFTMRTLDISTTSRDPNR